VCNTKMTPTGSNTPSRNGKIGSCEHDCHGRTNGRRHAYGCERSREYSLILRAYGQGEVMKSRLTCFVPADKIAAILSKGIE